MLFIKNTDSLKLLCFPLPYSHNASMVGHATLGQGGEHHFMRHSFNKIEQFFLRTRTIPRRLLFSLA